MRIEINSGGLDGAFAISEYQSNLSSYLSDAESVISSFKAVENATYGLNGGVGSLQSAVGDLSARIQQEEVKLEAAQAVQKKSNEFLELAVRVDSQVSVLVNSNKDAFYSVHPWLRPAGDVSAEAPLYEKAWSWLCGKGEAIAEGMKSAWEWAKDTAKKAWDGLVEFYNENKKIIDTILIVVGAIAAIAAVVASGGLALAPLLMALGCSAGAAAAISGTIAVLAVVTTLASGTMNVIDIWAEIDNPTFNAWQKGLGWASLVTNGIYSIGNIYNAKHAITNQDLKTFAKALQSDGRYGFGSHGQVVEYLSDFYPGSDAGIQHGMGTKEFYAIDNASGGKVYVSTDPIAQQDFASIVDNTQKNVNILTGTHGNIDGGLSYHYEFYTEDYTRWATNPNVNVFDISKLSKGELSLILNSPSINVCAWCYSERSRAVLQALNLIA